MSAVEYDLEGDSSSLVSSLEAAIRELTAATTAANQTTAATKKLTAEQKEAAEAAKKANDAHSGLVKILKQFGGEVAGVTDTLDDLGEGLEKLIPSLGATGTIAVTAGLGLGALAAAGAGVVATLISVARAAVEAGKKLGDTRADDLAVQVEGLDEAWMRLQVTMGENAAVKEAVEALAGLLEVLNIVVHAMNQIGDSEFADFIGTRLRVALAMATLGVSELARATVGFLEDLGESDAAVENIGAIEKAMENLKTATDGASDAQDLLNKRTALFAQDLSDVMTQDAADRKKAAAERIKESEEESARNRKAALDWLAEQKALEEEAEARRIAIAQHVLSAEVSTTQAQARAVSAYIDTIVAAQEKATEEFEKQLAEQQQMLEQAAMGMAQSFGQLFTTVGQAVADEWDARLSALDDGISKQEALIQTLKDQDLEGNKARIKEEQSQLAGLEAQKKRIAYDAFVSGKEQAIGEAIIAGALAVIQGFAQLGPIGGAIAASFVGAMTATQIGIIQAQSPPAHDGGQLGADEFNFGGRRVRDGEAAVVFNQRAVQTGALNEAARLNRDAGNGGSSEVRMVLGDAGRVIGELFARETRRPGSRLAAAFGSTGVTDPYRRSG